MAAPGNQQNIRVSEQAVQALEQMSAELQQQQAQLSQQVRALQNAFDENAAGLGPHSREIQALLEELDATAQTCNQCSKRLSRKLTRAAHIRRGLLEENPYRQAAQAPVAERADALYVPGVLGTIYDDLVRQRLRPRAMGPDGAVRGVWSGESFYASDDFVPEKFNPQKKTFGQLRQELADKYGISFGAISYAGGYADFSGVAVAQVNLGALVEARMKADPSLDLDTVLQDRAANFAAADRLAAAQQAPIPGLAAGYTAADLAQWRKENRFSWDESFQHGYLLVPSVIHGNLAHTGMVAVNAHGTDAEQAFARRHREK